MITLLFLVATSYLSLCTWIFYLVLLMEKIHRQSNDIEWTFKVVWFVLSFVPIFNSYILFSCIYDIDYKYIHTRIY